MKAWIGRWLAATWGGKQYRLRVAGEYAALRKSDFLLADLCRRNAVFDPVHATTFYEAGVAEGRRRCVFEMLELARIDPLTIEQSIAELAGRSTRGEDDP